MLLEYAVSSFIRALIACCHVGFCLHSLKHHQLVPMWTETEKDGAWGNLLSLLIGVSSFPQGPLLKRHACPLYFQPCSQFNANCETNKHVEQTMWPCRFCIPLSKETMQSRGNGWIANEVVESGVLHNLSCVPCGLLGVQAFSCSSSHMCNTCTHAGKRDTWLPRMLDLQ